MSGKPRNRTCTLKECTNKHEARGYCSLHYAQWRRSSNPEKCTAEGCDHAHASLGLCNMHYKRLRRNGTTKTTIHDPRVEIPRYRSMHDRVKAERGSASDYCCIDCGNRARHWSYNHCDNNEIIDAKTGSAYSLNTDHYQPRCTFCHRRFDLPRRAEPARTLVGTFT